MDKLFVKTRSFNPAYSSCSNLTPKNFRWTIEPSDTCVYTDDVLIYGLNDDSVSNKYGWLLESKAIIPQVYSRVREPVFKQTYKKIFTCDRELVRYDPQLFVEVFAGSNVPWCAPNSNPSKTKLCCMFCSPKLMCDGHVLRHTLAFKYRKYFDLYGGAHGSPRVGENGTPHPKKDDVLSQYMFCLVTENEIYDNYFTEKITDCFATKTVPIYYGSPSIGEFFNKDGILFFNPKENYNFTKLTRELYFSMIDAINDNYNKITNLDMCDDQIWNKI